MLLMSASHKSFLLLLCLLSCTFTPSNPSSVPTPKPVSPNISPVVDFFAIATAFSPQPSLIVQAEAPGASIASVDDNGSPNPQTLPAQPSQADIDSGMNVAKRENAKFRSRFQRLDRMMKAPRFHEKIKGVPGLAEDCIIFMEDVEHLVELGREGFEVIESQHALYTSILAKAGELVISLSTMEFGNIGTLIAQIVPDVGRLVAAIAPKLIPILKRAVPLAVDLLKTAVSVPVKVIKYVKDKVMRVYCRANNMVKKAISSKRLKKCLKKGYGPKGFEASASSPNQDLSLPVIIDASRNLTTVNPTIGIGNTLDNQTSVLPEVKISNIEEDEDVVLIGGGNFPTAFKEDLFDDF